MTHSTAVLPLTVGLDVGDRRTHFCVVDASRTVVARGSFATDCAQLEHALEPFVGAKVILEAGSQSPWMSRVLRRRGYDVQVADPRRVELISKDPRKTDRRDAEMLAKMGMGMPDLLGSIHHRGEQAQAHLSILRARELVVRMRTMAVLQVRSICKAFGVRLAAGSTRAFASAAAGQVPLLLQPALTPILETIAGFSATIRAFDRALAAIAKEHYPEVQHLQQVDGVGPVISVAYVLAVEDPKRFTRSRQVGSWLGLCPRSHASGASNPQLGISRAGDAKLRTLLVQGAHRLLGPFGADCDLRRYGLRLTARGGRAAKKRAAVAVARSRYSCIASGSAARTTSVSTTRRTWRPHRPCDATPFPSQLIQRVLRCHPPTHVATDSPPDPGDCLRTWTFEVVVGDCSAGSDGSHRAPGFTEEPSRVRMEACGVRGSRRAGAKAPGPRRSTSTTLTS